MLQYNVQCNNKTVMCNQKQKRVKCQTRLKSCVVRKALVAGWWHRVTATTQHLHQLTECAEEGLIEAFSLLYVLPSDFSLMPPCLTGILQHHFKAPVTVVLILSNHSCCLSSAACISARAATTSCFPFFLLPAMKNRQDCWLFSKAFFQAQVQVELYCHSATCGNIQWNEMSRLTGSRCYIQVHLNKLECREKVHFFL